MSRALEELHDRRAILALADAFSQSSHSGPLEVLLGLYTYDATAIYGEHTAKGHSALRLMHAGHRAEFPMTSTHHDSHTIRLDGANATGSLYGRARVTLSGRQFHCSYRYTDRYAKRDGAWQFAHRHFELRSAIVVD